MWFPAHLHNALAHISSWMNANLLTLNSTKTFFNWAETKTAVGNIHNSSLNAETEKSAKIF